MPVALKLLTKTQINKHLKNCDGWTLNPKGTALQQTFTFKDHVAALVFIARLTVHAQVLNHHPEILFTFKKVKVTLTTHDIKGISALDFEFIKRVEGLMRKSG